MAAFKTGRLTAANPSVSLENTAGTFEVSGTFDSGTVTMNLTGGATSFDSFTVDTAKHTQANFITFGITGGLGSEDVNIIWYGDCQSTDDTQGRALRRDAPNTP